MKTIDEVRLFTDGCCRTNPGPGAVACVVCDPGHRVLGVHCQCIGDSTKNRAEYLALINGLDMCALYTRRRVVCFSDSELLVGQMNGQYRLKNKQLRDLFHEVKKLEQMYDEVVYQTVDRRNRFIRKADRLLHHAFGAG